MYRKLFTALVVAGLGGVVVAQDPAKKDEKWESKVSADAKQTGCSRACYVNFSKELGVPFEYLNNIGPRIANARRAADPVDLALAAQSLAIAEKVSGKKAGVTSDEVFKEAAELAKARRISNELAAVALVVPDPAMRDDLTKAATLAKGLEADAAAKAKNASAPREIHGNLRVINHTDHCLRIYVSGRFVGEVHKGQTGNFHVHDSNYETFVEARCEDDGALIKRAVARGHKHDVTWHIHE